MLHGSESEFAAVFRATSQIVPTGALLHPLALQDIVAIALLGHEPVVVPSLRWIQLERDDKAHGRAGPRESSRLWEYQQEHVPLLPLLPTGVGVHDLPLPAPTVMRLIRDELKDLFRMKGT